jgi:hypothetical protein
LVEQEVFLISFKQAVCGKFALQFSFKISVALHGKQAQESSVLIDTTASEKNITYPTDAKLAIKIINRLNKLAKHHGLLGLFAMQGNTYFKNKIKTFNAYTLPKVYQLGGITRHTRIRKKHHLPHRCQTCH